MFEKLISKFSKTGKKLEQNRKIAKKLHDMPFKYISEKNENGEEVILARGGHLNLIDEKGEELAATVGVKTIFRLKVDEMDAWEFMSLDGCFITFFDLDLQKERSVTVSYEKRLTY